MTGLYVGTVARIDAAGVHVRVPQLAGAHVYGPCRILQGPWTPALTTEASAVGVSGAASAGTAHTHSTPAHTHGAGVDLAVGDTVLVGFATAVGGPTTVIFGRVA